MVVSCWISSSRTQIGSCNQVLPKFVHLLLLQMHVHAVHMEWRSKGRVAAPLGRAFIQYLLLLLPTLQMKYEASKARTLASLQKARSTAKLKPQDSEAPWEQGRAELKPSASPVVTHDHGTCAMVDAPMQVRLETFAETKAAVGELAYCA